MDEMDRILKVSRRSLMKGGAAAALASSRVMRALSGGMAYAKAFAYVGTYTGQIGAGSNGEGIYRFIMNPSTGELTERTLVAKSDDPSWIAIHPLKKCLYAANEVNDYKGSSGSVSAFGIDAASGSLTALNVVSSQGAGPCYLSLDAAGKFIYVANYGGGSVAALPVHADGSLGEAVAVHRDSGSPGAAQATNAPTGSFAVSGHDAPHAHTILPAPDGRFVLATDLGQDRIYAYPVCAEGMADFEHGEVAAQLPSGDGPRHLAFHSNGKWLYSIQEESSTIALLDYDADHGTLTARHSVSSLPKGFVGSSFASEVMIAPNGRTLYAANRLHDTIAAFNMGADGRLAWVGEASTMGDYPGQCRIDPSGQFLYACNRRSDAITCFRIDGADGLPRFTGQYTAVGSPASITFMSK